LVIVTGDAGVGKSRLLYEFENWIDLHPASAYFFKGRALATRQSVPFGLARDLFGDRFGVLDSDSPAVVAEKLGSGFAPPLGAGEAEVVGHWLGFDLSGRAAVQRLLGAGQLPATARAHLVSYLDAMAADSLVVVFLEDLHWADADSLALVDELAAALAGARVLVVGVARPELRQRADAAALFARAATDFHLGPLDTDATRTLVAEVLQNASYVPDELTDLIAARADGNAFYVEELVKMLIEDGVIETGDAWEQWRVDVDRLDPARVPATLTGVLQTRLDSLGAPDRAALQRSSVVGRVFWDGTVAALGAETVEATARSLAVARERELVFRRDRSSFDDNVEYTFKHALLRDVTYETVLLRDRQRLHGMVARWITEHAGDRLIEYAGLIAAHHRLAGELGTAASLLHRAAAAALDTGNSAGARRNLAEAFDLWREDGREPPVAALTDLAEACVRLGDLEEARRRSETALDLATTRRERVAAGVVAAWAAGEVGDREREKALFTEALPEAEQVGGVLLERVVSGLAWSAAIDGDVDQASVLAQRAMALADAMANPASLRRATQTLAILAQVSGDSEAALRHARDGLQIALDAGDLDGAALGHGNVGVAHHLLGDRDGTRLEYEQAVEHYEQAQALNRRLGRRVGWALTESNLAQVHLRLGDDLAARRHLRDALVEASTVGSIPTEIFAVLCEADRRLTRGDTAGALALMHIVRVHPAFTEEHRVEIERILGRNGLTADGSDQGEPARAGEDFAAAVDRIIAELGGS
jgi:tetratricopeptide (TPR) repeat protein